MKRSNHFRFLLPIVLALSSLQLGNFVVNRLFFPFVGLIFGVIGIFFTQRFFVTSNQKVVILWSVFSWVLFSLFSLFSFTTIRELVFDVTKVGFAYVYSIVIMLLVANSAKNVVSRALNTSLIIVSMVLVIDTAQRLSTFSYNDFLSNFYIYKTNSLFFSDTNGLALFYLCYSILFIFAHQILDNRVSKLILIIITILLALTFSRAVIVSWFIGLFYYSGGVKKLNFNRALLLLILSVYIFTKSDSLFSLLESGSGATKIEIYDSLIVKFPRETLRSQLFGNGINLGNYIYGWGRDGYSHALIPMIIGQFGLLGMLLYFSLFVIGNILFNKLSIIALLVLFVAGLSYLHPFLESVFIVNGFLWGLIYHNRTNENHSSNR